MSNSKLPTGPILGAIAALALIGTSPALAQGAKFGLFTPLTGASSVVGLDMQRGVELAVQRINEGYDVPLKDGSTKRLEGVLNGEIEIIVEDDESRAAAAMDAVRKLVNSDQVDVVLGEYSSGRTLPTGQFTNENKVIHISIGANSPTLREIGPYFFDAIGLATAQGPELIKLAQELTGAETFATLFPNNPFGVGVEIATCEAAATMGAECVAKVRYEEQKTDYRPELRQIDAPDPDAVIFFAYGADATLIFRQAYEMGLDAADKWIGTEVSNWEADVQDAPQTAEGVRGIEHAVGGSFYEDTYANAYEAAFGSPPATAFGAFGYDAAMLAALGIDQAGTTDSDAVREAIIEVSKSYKALTGDIEMDEDGMRLSQSYGTFIFKDGKLQPLE